MNVKTGDVVRMRDGRIVEVTDAADPGEPVGEYQTISREAYARGEVVVTSSMPAETIFMGNLFAGNRNTGQRVVSDMSEVVSILN